jgi:hypothetical protein
MKYLTIIFWCLSTFLIYTGFVFKFMHWPGASVMLVLGFTLAIPSFIIFLIARYKNKENARLGTYGAYMFVVFLGVGLTIYQGITASRDLLNNFIDISDSGSQQVKRLQVLTEHKKFNKYNEVRLQTQEVITLIEEGKSFLIQESGGTDQNGRPLGKDNMDISAQHYLVNDEGKNGMDLQLKINTLHEKYSGLYAEDSTDLLFLLAVGRANNYGGFESWLALTFEHSTLASVLAKLSNIQVSILTSELILYNHLESQSKDH